MFMQLEYSEIRIFRIGTTGCDTKMIKGSREPPIVGQTNTSYARSHIPLLCFHLDNQSLPKDVNSFVTILSYDLS